MKVNRARRKGTIHPWMKAYLGVFEHPYFALSGADGRFTLKDLPPGEHTIEAWHERFGTRSQKITVAQKRRKRSSLRFSKAKGYRPKATGFRATPPAA